MKKSILLLIFLNILIGVNSYSQDTTNFINSGCLSMVMKSLSFQNGPPHLISFNYSNDSLRITGEIGANCGSAHIAIINKTADTIFIATLDTGSMTTCSCSFGFGFKIKALATDTIIKFNGKVFNSKHVYDQIKDHEKDHSTIITYPNPTGDILHIATRGNMEIKKVTILDVYGRPLKIQDGNISLEMDMTGLKAGIYFLDFEINGERHLIKKIQKK